MVKLSVLIPAYNESNTICTILDRVGHIKLLQGEIIEIIVVNDCSKDETEEKVLNFKQANPHLNIKHIIHHQNLGKGASIQTGLLHTTGDYVIIQDADLEYDPNDYNDLIEPVLKGNADVVYGSRFIGSKPHRILFFWHYIGNKFLTFLSNLFTNLNLTDMETGYKLFKTEVLRQITLCEKGFGFEPEVTAKISRIKGITIYEVGISYYGRTYEEGKKITWTDGIMAIWCIIIYNVFK